MDLSKLVDQGSSGTKDTCIPKHIPPFQPAVTPNETPKWPIPPLNRATSCLKKRTTHACRPCQEHKSKCSGERPQCQRCATLQMCCWYTQRKREYRKRRLEELSTEARDYKSVLQQIQPGANSDDSNLITSVLKKHETSNGHSRQGSRSAYTSSPEPSPNKPRSSRDAILFP